MLATIIRSFAGLPGAALNAAGQDMLLANDTPAPVPLLLSNSAMKVADRPDAAGLADRTDRRGLMAALDCAQCLVWFDAEGQVIEGNQNAQDLLGLTADTLVGQTYRELAGDPHKHEEYFVKHWGRIASGALRAEERELVGKDCRVWASITYAAVKRQDGQTRRVFALIIDLSPWSAKPKGVYARMG